MSMDCTTRAAFFPRVHREPQELALHTKLRIELNPYTSSDWNPLFVGSSTNLHLILRFLPIHRHMKGSTFDSRLPREIGCKLEQLLRVERSSNCTCIQRQPNSACEAGIATCNSRCEVTLIDALTFEVDIWSLLPSFPRHGEHMANDVRGLFQDQYQKRRDSQ